MQNMEAEPPIQAETKGRRNPFLSALISIGIVLLGMGVIWVGFTAVLSTTTPFFVVSSGSMIPNLEIGDIIVVTGNPEFKDLKVGDIIVFDEPGRGSKVIVHRVYSIYDDAIRRVVTKGDHNSSPDDWRVTSNEYIGKVVFAIPKVGYLTTTLVPPMNYIVIVIVIAAVFILEIRAQRTDKKPSEDETPPEETLPSDEPQTVEDEESKL